MEDYKPNFLAEQHKHAKQSRRQAWLRILVIPFRLLPTFLFWLVIICIVAVLLLGLASIPYINSFRFIAAEALDGKNQLEIAQHQFEDQKFAAAYDSLNQASESFGQADEELKELAQKPLFRLPAVKGQVEIADDILSLGYNLSSGLSKVALFASDVMSISGQQELNLSQIDEAQRAEILSRLVELGEELETTKTEIDQARLAWQNLSLRPN
jgi:hypothetical protein